MPPATPVTTTDQKTPLNSIWGTFTVDDQVVKILLPAPPKTASFRVGRRLVGERRQRLLNQRADLSRIFHRTKPT